MFFKKIKVKVIFKDVYIQYILMYNLIGGNMKRKEEQNVIIGRKLKEYRENRGYTQEEVAKEIEVNPKHYGRIERGENSCTVSNLITLCNLLGISTEDLMGALTYTKPDNGISNDFQKLTIEDKLSVSNYIEFLISRYKN